MTVSLVMAFVLGLMFGMVTLGIGAVAIYNSGRAHGHEEGERTGEKCGIELGMQKERYANELRGTVLVSNPTILLDGFRLNGPSTAVPRRKICHGE